MNTSLLAQELAPLNAQIERVRQKHEGLEGELRVVEAELEKFSADKQRFDALRDVCNAFVKLEDLKAGELFWAGLSEGNDTIQHLKRVQGRVAGFDEKIRGILEKQASLRQKIDKCLDELEILNEEVRDAYDREERRKEEFIIEREVSTVPYRTMIMPWTKKTESERRIRLAVLMALLICSLIGYLIPMINVPIADPTVDVVEIPERLAKLVKKEPPKPAPMPPPAPKQIEEKPEEPKEQPKESKQEPKEPQKKPKKHKTEPKPRSEQKKPDKPSKGGGEPGPEPRKKAEHVGVLAFKSAFADLMDETPVAKLGTEARLSKESPQVAGQAVAQRSLVAIQAQGGSSGGISNAGVSRNVGSGNVDRIGGGGIGKGGGGGNGNGTGFARVESGIADLQESSRPLSDGVAPGRTDEEIQIVFDRYKAALYRIYNRELRKDPTLRGKMLLRISIETSGAVSMCRVESTDLASPELVAKIVERIKRFNFGPKEGVPKMTILYPIDFLPAA
ncbi:MAG: AgmX/PglI C-terminal domain-containing protein [Desulfobacterales bacterium]